MTALSRSMTALSRSMTAPSRSMTALSRSITALSRSMTAPSRSMTAPSRSMTAPSLHPLDDRNPHIMPTQRLKTRGLTIYAPMIYPVPCVMLLMRAASITWTIGRGLALEIESFLGPVKWHRADRQVPFGAQKTQMLARDRPRS
jgi:hypothetical protein